VAAKSSTSSSFAAGASGIASTRAFETTSDNGSSTTSGTESPRGATSGVRLRGEKIFVLTMTWPRSHRVDQKGASVFSGATI
jgi:hypothetical protein